MTRVGAVLSLALAVLALGAVDRPRVDAVAVAGGRTEVVVALAAPPLARAPGTAAQIDAEQREFRSELARRLPDARVRWRYRLVANGYAVDLPTAQLPRLRELSGVRDVFASASYTPQLDSTPEQIGAPGLWGAGLETAGQSVKIGVIDTGIDQSHPFFDPAGYTMPAGFPKGQIRFTNAKVIVARAFPPPGVRYRNAALAFDSESSTHGTHVAGIAAGNARTPATGGRVVSGIAPRAFIGNYKALVGTDSGLSPNGNAPEIVAAIEAAVRDGMDVLNLSIGEPEIEPSRDVVALALDAAAEAGVVPVVAAGNDYNDLGAGTVSSPANAASAITVGAVEIGGTPPTGEHADFSSVGPTSISYLLKPDVAAPGVGVLSAVPGGGWSSLSGTSMASPHIAGAAALLAQRHPEWTVAQIKSALVQTGANAVSDDDRVLGPEFHGGGVVSLAKADRPLVFALPASVSLGLLSRGEVKSSTVALSDAGGGAGTWMVRRDGAVPAGVRLSFEQAVEVPGELVYDVTVSAGAKPGDVSGYFVLRREGAERRIPLWGRVSAAALARHQPVTLRKTGAHRATTRGRRALVSRYRYPEDPRGVGLTTVLRGPELVYRVRLTTAVANFGVVVTQRAEGSRVEPRVVAGSDENRLTGYAALPFAHNPYLDGFRRPILAAGALSPLPGEYAVVFDSATRAGAGRFTFRFWIHDVTPPKLHLQTRSVKRGDPIRVAAADAGSGVYGESAEASVDGANASASFREGVVHISTVGLKPGRHRVRLRVSDYQEAKNTENVARILPNTRALTATFTVRGA